MANTLCTAYLQHEQLVQFIEKSVYYFKLKTKKNDPLRELILKEIVT